MKTLLITVASIAILLSGCKSKEEKVNELIKDNMFKVLYDFASYEPIETKIDSAFTSVYTDTIIIGHASFIKSGLEKVNEYIAEIKDAEKTLEFWICDHSSYGKTRIYEANNKYNENLEKFISYFNKKELHSDSIRYRASYIKNEFCGWKATHKFRCKTKGGSSDIGNYEYIFDKDLKKIIFKVDLDDEAYIKIKKLIDEALESKKESEDVDFSKKEK